MKRFELLGVNDDETACTCCGRTELKAVMWLRDMTTDEVFHVGRDCGAKLLKCTVKEFRAFEKSEVSRQKQQAYEIVSQLPEVVAYRAKINELEGMPPMTWEQRKAIIWPLVAAADAARKEVQAKFPLAGHIAY